ncbi:MAG: glutaminyl-peptide cyclotransferase [Kiritimatiellae bacterium]|nr:glutaminyl-peptide cyclotransferase [Kiritimatiellia bacterium]
MRSVALLALLIPLLALTGCSATQKPAASADYEILRILPHDASAFTQGLLFHDGKLFESTGLYGQSTLREVDLQTGEIARKRALPHNLFGEGLALYSNRLYQLTWRENIILLYDATTFETTGSLPWKGQGWGLTAWSNQLIASDGSAQLRFYDPQTMKLLGEVTVRDQGQPIAQLNELEMVEGELLANIWREDRVARIDPSTGNVLGWLDFSPLVPEGLRASREAVLNGLAYDPATKRLFVTGKNWPVLYEIRLSK